MVDLNTDGGLSVSFDCLTLDKILAQPRAACICFTGIRFYFQTKSPSERSEDLAFKPLSMFDEDFLESQSQQQQHFSSETDGNMETQSDNGSHSAPEKEIIGQLTEENICKLDKGKLIFFNEKFRPSTLGAQLILITLLVENILVSYFKLKSAIGALQAKTLLEMNSRFVHV